MLAFHPLAEVFPLIEGEDFNSLVQSIKDNGLQHPVVLYDGKVLDGRNRYRACLAAEIEPKTEVFAGRDPLQFVLTNNLHRRHLTESQRAMVAARIATLKQGDNQHSPYGGTSQAKAAELLNIGRRSVERASTVLNHGTKEEIKAVENGNAFVTKTADAVLARRGKKPSSKKKASRVQKLRISAAIWKDVKIAVLILSQLPDLEDVVAAVRANDKSGLIAKHLPRARRHLEGFSHAWTQNTQG